MINEQITSSSENMTWNWNIEFVDVTVNREDLTGGQYDYILLQLRSRLEDDCVSSGGNTCPVLPEYTTNNDRVRWFEIRLYLANPSTRIRLRFRRDDLYLVGYQVNDQQWREFNSEDGSQTHLIDGSRFLGFTGSYEHLTNEAHIELNQVTVGGQSLVNAAYSLATATTREAIAKALLVMILMFSEAARFRPVQNYMQRNFMDGATVPDWIDDLIHRWGTLSGTAMYYSRNPQAPWVNQNLEIEGQTVVLRTLGQLLFYMGILQNKPKPPG